MCVCVLAVVNILLGKVKSTTRRTNNYSNSNMQGNLLFYLFLAVTSYTTSALASRLTPPVLPLIVRNPYLSTWLGNARDPPWTKWPMFYTGEEIGLSLMATVPNTEQLYPLLGRPQDSLLPQESNAGYVGIYIHTYNFPFIFLLKTSHLFLYIPFPY